MSLLRVWSAIGRSRDRLGGLGNGVRARPTRCRAFAARVEHHRVWRDQRATRRAQGRQRKLGE